MGTAGTRISVRRIQQRAQGRAQREHREEGETGDAARQLGVDDVHEHFFLAETTVQTHVTRILAKLGLRDPVQAVIVAYQTGLVRLGAN